MSAGLSFSLGGAYRQAPIYNPVLVVVWGLVVAGVCVLFLPNTWWGSTQFELATSAVTLLPCGQFPDPQNPRECLDECKNRPHEVIPLEFRLLFIMVCFIHMVVVVAVEKFIITMAVEPKLKEKFPARHLPLDP